jgi:hypothetical protein
MPKEYSTPGPRAIYPELCDSRSLAKCGIVANALWPRLVVQADDQGRLAGNAIDVLGLCFPKMLDRVTVRQVRTALDEIEVAGMIARYEVDGEPYVQILTWWDWQASMRRAYPSRHPARAGWDDAVYGFEDHPPTYRAVRGLPARRHAEDEPDPSDGDAGTALEPHRAGTATAREPHRAVPEADTNRTLPAPEPHRAALTGAQPHARVQAQPRVRGARPDPTRPMPENEEIPPPPAERGRRKDETNPRAESTAPRQTGANPRANGASPRQEREAEKRGPTKLGDILAEAQRRQQGDEEPDKPAEPEAVPWLR